MKSSTAISWVLVTGVVWCAVWFGAQTIISAGKQNNFAETQTQPTAQTATQTNAIAADGIATSTPTPTASIGSDTVAIPKVDSGKPQAKVPILTEVEYSAFKKLAEDNINGRQSALTWVEIQNKLGIKYPQFIARWNVDPSVDTSNVKNKANVPTNNSSSLSNAYQPSDFESGKSPEHDLADKNRMAAELEKVKLQNIENEKNLQKWRQETGQPQPAVTSTPPTPASPSGDSYYGGNI